MPLETVKLTASFKLDGSIPEGLFSTYREILDQLLDHACAKGITSFKLLHGAYHEKFKEMKIGQAWLVKSEDFYLKAVFSKVVEVAMDGKAVAVDVNENNIAFGTAEHLENRETRERAIRTAYFLKRRRLQSKPRLNEKQLMAKYKGRERRRVEAIYHRIAKEVVAKAKEAGASTIVMEDLEKIRRKHKKGRSKAINGRLNRWSFRKFQNIVDYKARLAGLNVKYIEADYTSSLCPVCGEKLSPNGYRQMKCSGCGLEEDRDVIAVKNLLRRYQMDAGASVHPEGPSMTTERDEKYERGRDES
jgi:putative transposase